MLALRAQGRADGVRAVSERAGRARLQRDLPVVLEGMAAEAEPSVQLA